MYTEKIWTVVAVAIVSILLSYYYVKNITQSVTEMANSGLLFVSNITKAQNSLLTASQIVKKLFYIKVAKSDSEYLSLASKQIYNVYNKATTHCNDLDVRLMLKPLDVNAKIPTSHVIDTILYDSALSKDVDNLKLLLPEVKTAQCIELDESIPENLEEVKTYDHVVVGGTFDRLHNGHKILLSHAALRANKMLTVGVSNEEIIKSKKLYELIEPIEKRVKNILHFLTDIKPDIEYNVVPIQDVYGPTRDDPGMNLIVLSEETVRGGQKVNELRKQKNLSPLDTYVISLSEDTSRKSDDEETKVSSTNQRMRLLGTLLRPVLPNPDIPAWPYVIGLAGGIASGKSSVAKRLEQKGAVILNCDIIAHELYKPGLPLNRTIAETFGDHVITEAGEVDRRKLGEIVFSDPSKLQQLNDLLWPEIIAEAERRIRALGQTGVRVVVMEAAVMVRAKWYTRTHQLWSVIIPPEEAVKRICERNGLSEDEAQRRVASQPTNEEQVAHAHVVFSPYWSYDHTQEQVDRAWEHLMNYLDSRK